MNKVEVFREKSRGELAILISQFWAEHNYKHITISIFHLFGGLYNAFVAVED